MKTKYIAAASLVACASTAWAQSGVTLYGVVDTNVEYATNLPGATPGSSGNRVAMQGGGLSGSRWGLRGVEDLGSGLGALFVLESGFFSNNGQLLQGRMFSRQAYVGLNSSTAGKFTFGRQYTTLFLQLANFQAMAYAPQYEPILSVLGLNFRSDNTAMYTGTFGPVTAQAHWSFGTGAPSVNPTGGGNGQVPGQARRDSGYGAGVAYFAGPIGATLVYDQYNPSVPTGGGAFSSGSVRKAAVAGSYLFGDALKVMGGYRWGQNKNVNGSVALRDDYYWAGLNYQATNALGLSLEYSYQKIKTINSAPSAQPNPWQLAFVADYNLSKRTALYLSSAYARNAGLTLDQAAVDGNALGYGLAAGKTSMVGVAVGMRHKF
jgi:predicted porin